MSDTQSFGLHLQIAGLIATLGPKYDQSLIDRILSSQPNGSAEGKRRQQREQTAECFEQAFEQNSLARGNLLEHENEGDENRVDEIQYVGIVLKDRLWGCASTANSREYSHVTSAEYPNGDVEYLHNVDETDTVRDSRSVGWAMVVYGHNTNKANQTFYKTCLGVYQCPKCTYVERPRSLASNRSKQAPPLPAKGVCVADGSTLVHISCNAKMKVVHHHKGKSVRFIHQGFHNHAKPHPIRVTPEAQDKRKLQDVAESTSKEKKQSRKVL
ncbi:hypothetical protein BGX34_004565 [Mortierella sp. NVP85]|nr:hypothetical protein BGX34_004565 [Mortierella sp. NVP85]